MHQKNCCDSLPHVRKSLSQSQSTWCTQAPKFLVMEGRICEWQTREERKKRTQPPPKEILLGNFSGLKEKLSRSVVDTKTPMKTRKTISTTEIFPLWTPFFRQRKVLHWSGAVYAFFFPANLDLLVLASLEIGTPFFWQGFPRFLEFLPLIPHVFWGSIGKKILVFLVVFLAFLRKAKKIRDVVDFGGRLSVVSPWEEKKTGFCGSWKTTAMPKEVNRQDQLLSGILRGQKKHINSFNITFWPPPKTPHFRPPRKKLMYLFPGKGCKKRTYINLFGRILVVKKGAPNGQFRPQKV